MTGVPGEGNAAPATWPSIPGSVSAQYPGAPLTGHRSVRPRARFLPTALVAMIAAAVVLGGVALDNVVAESSIGAVAVGDGLQVEAAPGWVRIGASGTDWIELQKGDCVLAMHAIPGEADARSLIDRYMREVQASSDNTQIVFGEVEEGTLGDNVAANVTFTAITTSQPLDGQVIAVVHAETAVLLQAVAPPGDLQPYANDITKMAASVTEAGR